MQKKSMKEATAMIKLLLHTAIKSAKDDLVFFGEPPSRSLFIYICNKNIAKIQEVKQNTASEQRFSSIYI